MPDALVDGAVGVDLRSVCLEQEAAKASAKTISQMDLGECLDADVNTADRFLTIKLPQMMIQMFVLRYTPFGAG